MSSVRQGEMASFLESPQTTTPQARLSNEKESRVEEGVLADIPAPAARDRIPLLTSPHRRHY